LTGTLLQHGYNRSQWIARALLQFISVLIYWYKKLQRVHYIVTKIIIIVVEIFKVA